MYRKWCERGLCDIFVFSWVLGTTFVGNSDEFSISMDTDVHSEWASSKDVFDCCRSCTSSILLRCSVWIRYYCEHSWIHCFLSVTTCYLIMKFWNQKKQPVRVFFYSLLYLSAMSIYSMITDYMSYSLDPTTFEMIIIAKVQMLAWSVYDGTVDRV